MKAKMKQNDGLIFIHTKKGTHSNGAYCFKNKFQLKLIVMYDDTHFHFLFVGTMIITLRKKRYTCKSWDDAESINTNPTNHIHKNMSDADVYGIFH